MGLFDLTSLGTHDLLDGTGQMETLTTLWDRSRSGSHAGRGFHYQDAIAAHLAIQGWASLLPIQVVIPEGHEDVSVLVTDDWLHVQAKSKRSHRGEFSIDEVAAFLLKAYSGHEARTAAQPDSRFALVLERNIKGFSKTGWTRAIPDEPGLAATLADSLLNSLESPARVQDLLDSASIEVISDPREGDLATIAGVLGLPISACEVHYHVLLSVLTQLADENGERQATDPAQITIGDIQSLFDHCSELVDVESLEQAIRDGICEAADFVTPIHSPGFYEGIDVVPGHVVAGLTFERPEVEHEITLALERQEIVLVVGPSGSGKSASAWMSAFSSRHRIRWYRVKRLSAADVTVLLRLVRAVRPSENAPVGLVVDDLGRGDREGWDFLVAESRSLPGVRLLGVIREEDLPTLTSASYCHQVRPALTEALADRLWQEIRGANATKWPGWREPFEMSNRLLLEFGYLLTTGERLAATVSSQVGRRVSERRFLELRIVRLVSTADSWGATIDANGLRRTLKSGETDEDLQAALQRLIEEHLVWKASDGTFGGLHRVRSKHIVEEVHRLGVPTLSESVCSVVSILSEAKLERFINNVMTEEVISDEDMLNCLGTLLTNTPVPIALIAILNALRMTSFVRIASTWPVILEEIGVPPSKRALTIELSLAKVSSQHFLPSIQAGVDRLSGDLESDLRVDLLNGLTDDTFEAILSQIQDIDTATKLLRSLMAIPDAVSLQGKLLSLGSTATGPGIDLVAGLLEAARAVDLELAEQLAKAAGGSEALLLRIEEEYPWSRNLQIATDEAGLIQVEGVVIYVSPDNQPDIRDDVLHLCRLMFSCVPGAERVWGRAIDTSGALAGYGDYHMADMHLSRKAIPGNAEVQWNRYRARAATARVSAPNRTTRLLAEVEILRKLAATLSKACDSWCRAQTIPTAIRMEMLRIVADAEQLLPAPLDNNINPDGEQDSESFTSVDALDQLVSGIANTIARLMENDGNSPALAAWVYSLLEHVDRLADPDRWELIGESPSEPIESIRHDLENLHVVIAESCVGGEAARHAFAQAIRRSRSYGSLERCAAIARRMANERFAGQIAQLKIALAADALESSVLPYERTDTQGFAWPRQDLLIAISLPSIFMWDRAVAALPERLKVTIADQNSGTRNVVAAPLRDGKLVSSLAGPVLSRFHVVPEAMDNVGDLPWPVLVEGAASDYWNAIQFLEEISAMLKGSQNIDLHIDTENAINVASQKFADALRSLRTRAESDESGLVGESLQLLNTLAERVKLQLEAFNEGQPQSATLADDLIATARLETNETFQEIALYRYALIELDVSPQGVRDRIERAFTELSQE